MPKATALDHAGQDLSLEQIAKLPVAQAIVAIEKNAAWLANEVKNGSKSVKTLIASLPGVDDIEELASMPAGRIAQILKKEAKGLAGALRDGELITPKTADDVAEAADRIVEGISNGHLATMTVGGVVLIILALLVLFKVVL